MAADAVHGVPSNFDDDERLSLGGLSTNQQLTSPLVPGKRSKQNLVLIVSSLPLEGRDKDSILFHFVQICDLCSVQ